MRMPMGVTMRTCEQAKAEALEADSSLQGCRRDLDECNATGTQVQNTVAELAAQRRAAETALEDAQHQVAAADAGRQQAVVESVQLRAELEACIAGGAGGAGAAETAPIIKELSSDSLTLSSEPAGAAGLVQGESAGDDEDGASCGLTPDSCGADAHGAGAGVGGKEDDGAGKAAPVRVMSGGEFEAHVEGQAKSGGVTFVKFFAPWCGHCKRMTPVWEELGVEFERSADVTIAKVDCTQAQDLCKELGVEGLPTLKLFKQGRPFAYSGKKDIGSLVAFVNSHVSSATVGASASLDKLESPAPGGSAGADSLMLSSKPAGAAGLVQGESAGDDEDGASCGLTPDSCGADAHGAATSSVAGGDSSSSSSSASAKASEQMSDDAIAAFYENLKKGTAGSPPATNPPAPAAAPAPSPQLGKLKSGAADAGYCSVAVDGCTFSSTDTITCSGARGARGPRIAGSGVSGSCSIGSRGSTQGC